MNRLRILCLAAGLAAMLSLCATASAATFTEHRCTGDPSNDLPGDWRSIADDQWTISHDCPAGIGISHTGESQTGAFGVEHRMELLPGLQLDSVSVLADGSDGAAAGLSQGIQVCRGNICGPLKTATGAALPFPDRIEFARSVPGEIPDDADSIVIRGQCVAGPCSPAAGITFTDLDVTYWDDTAPEFTSIFEHDDDFHPIPQSEAPWHNGQIYFGWEGYDLESGIAYNRISAGFVEFCVPGYASFVPGCTMWDPQITPYFEASEIPDGTQPLTITQVNRAGLETTATWMLKIDKTPPARPQNVKVIPSRNGWASDKKIRIEWTNPGESAETDEQSGIAGVRYDIDPLVDDDQNPAPPGTPDPDPVTVKLAEVNSIYYEFPDTGKWAVEITMIDGAGNESPSAEAVVNIDHSKTPAPEFEPLAAINAADAQTGRTINWSLPYWTVSGVCGYDYAFSPLAAFNPGEDPATPALNGFVLGLTMSGPALLNLPEGAQYFHLRPYSCSGNPGEVAHEPVIVDFTAPTVTFAPASGVVSAGQPLVIKAEDVRPGTQQSGVKRIVYTIGSQTEVVDGPVATVSNLPGGRPHLSAYAEDEAGNLSDAIETDLTVDGAPPKGWFAEPDVADPTKVSLTFSDTESGVAEAFIEYQAEAGGPWRVVGDRFRSGDPTPGSASINAHLPDDGEIPAGGYRLQGVVTDAVGRTAFVTTRIGGGAATFVSPLRRAATLTASLRTAKRPGAPTGRLVVGFGQAAVLSGVLAGADGHAVGGATIQIAAEQPGAVPRVVATVTTDASGAYRYAVASGPSRTFTATFAGNSAIGRTSAQARLLTKGRVTLRVTKKTVKSGKWMRLRGRVLTAGAAIPLRGKAVEIEIGNGRTRSLLRITRKTDSAGRFDIRYRYLTRGRSVRLVLRAIATVEPTWPFEEGVSSPVKVKVIP